MAGAALRVGGLGYVGPPWSRPGKAGSALCCIIIERRDDPEKSKRLKPAAALNQRRFEMSSDVDFARPPGLWKADLLRTLELFGRESSNPWEEA